MDILAAALGLLLLSPFFAFIGALIKRDSPGPVFYRGPRLGRGGRVFQILKFRTMREEPASYAGPCITGQGRPAHHPAGEMAARHQAERTAPVMERAGGRDEPGRPAPGDPRRSPRPGRRPCASEILSVRPGITSPASIAYHDEEKRLNAARVMEDYRENIMPDKLRLDQLYVRHHTFITDLDSLFWTFVVLIPRLKERKISEGWLFGGPLTRLLRRYLSWTAIDFMVAFLSIGLVGPAVAPERPAGYWPVAGLQPGARAGVPVRALQHPARAEECFLVARRRRGCAAPDRFLRPGHARGCVAAGHLPTATLACRPRSC